MAGFFENLFFNLRGETKLFVRKVLKDHVYLQTQPLYGLKLMASNDIVGVADTLLLRKLMSVKSGPGSKYLFLVIIKNKVTNFYRTNIYMFSYSKPMLDVLKTELSNRVVQELSGLEIANILFTMLKINNQIDFDFITGKMSPLDKYFLSPEDAEEKFKIFIQEIDNSDTKCFVGCNYSGTDVLQFSKIFELQWTGVLYLCLHLDDQLDLVQRKLQQSLLNRQGLVSLKNAIEKKEAEVGAISVSFITKDTNTEYLLSLFSKLGFIPLEKNFGRDYYVFCTPLLVKDLDYYFQIPIDTLATYLIISFSKNYIPNRVILYGQNRFQDYVAFNNFEENDNPHVMLFAPSGAGKSFFLQNFLSQVLRLNLKALYTGELDKTPPPPSDIYIRHFDKGFSAEILYKLMQYRKYDVESVSPRIENMAYNICEVQTEDDYEFSLCLVNALLSALEQEPLQGLERTFYIRALKEAYSSPSDFISIRKQPIGKLMYIYDNKDTGMQKTISQLLKLGYHEDTLIEDIKEPQFEFLKYATILDVIRILSQSKSLTLTHTEKEGLDNTITKLEILSTYDLIRKPATFDFKTAKLFYFDYEFLYSHTFFTPLFLALLKKLIYVDKFYKKEDEYAYYIIDEAHNLFRKPVFAELISILIREARKFKISIVLATQNFVDIPVPIIQNANTKMFLTPQEHTQKKAYLKELSKHIDTNLDDEVIAKVYYEMPARQLTTWYRDGVFSLLLSVDEYKLKIFDSYRKTLLLPDGYEIKKSLVLEQ